MTKAFTKETEDVPRKINLQPSGDKTYLTPKGYSRLMGELNHLRRTERPRVVEVVSWAAGNGDRSENGDYLYGKKRLREIDRRIRYLIKRLEIAIVVDSKQQKIRDRIFFGATVIYADGRGLEHTVRIVGIDEARHDRGEVSWVSPIAKALHKASEGDVVMLRTPSGLEEIEIIKILYKEPA